MSTTQETKSDYQNIQTEFIKICGDDWSEDYCQAFDSSHGECLFDQMYHKKFSEPNHEKPLADKVYAQRIYRAIQNLILKEWKSQ